MARDSLGLVLNASEKGLLVKARNGMVPIGTPVVDVRNQPVGRVSDVIGPVNGPYLLIKPSKAAMNNLQRLLQKEVYAP